MAGLHTKSIECYSRKKEKLIICKNMERVMGIEPTLFAWEARVLPLNDTRVVNYCGAIILHFSLASVGGLA